MKIHLVSDLHLDSFKVNPFSINDKADVLIISGDLCNGFKKSVIDWLNNDVSKYYEYIFIVLGNYDYYNEEYFRVKDKWKNYINKNIILLDDDIFEYKGYKIIGSTLWSYIQPHNHLKIRNSISDYWCILYNNYLTSTNTELDMSIKYITVNDVNILFGQHKIFLENNIDDKSIVITHHLPSFNCIDDQYKGNSINEAFASNLDYLIYEKNPLLWFFGHTHSSYNNVINTTRLYCNPVGYGFDRNKKFNNSLIIEV